MTHTEDLTSGLYEAAGDLPEPVAGLCCAAAHELAQVVEQRDRLVADLARAMGLSDAEARVRYGVEG